MDQIRRVGALVLVTALALTACSSTPAISADEAAVRAAVEASLAAENAADAEAFVALWTDEGLEAYDVGSREELLAGENEDFGSEDFAIDAFVESTVSDDTASVTIDASRSGDSFASPIYRVSFELLKDGEDWLLDGFEFLGGPPIAEGTEVLDIKAQEYAFIMDETEVGAGVAMRFDNVGDEQHELTLYRAPSGTDIATAKPLLEGIDGGSLEGIPDGYEVAHITFAEPGDVNDVVFAAPLSAGTYVLTCYIPQGGFGPNGPVNPKGKPHIELGMIATLEVA